MPPQDVAERLEKLESQNRIKTGWLWAVGVVALALLIWNIVLTSGQAKNSASMRDLKRIVAVDTMLVKSLSVAVHAQQDTTEALRAVVTELKTTASNLAGRVDKMQVNVVSVRQATVRDSAKLAVLDTTVAYNRQLAVDDFRYFTGQIDSMQVSTASLLKDLNKTAISREAGIRDATRVQLADQAARFNRMHTHETIWNAGNTVLAIVAAVIRK
jgi:hypothetical protein